MGEGRGRFPKKNAVAQEGVQGLFGMVHIRRNIITYCCDVLAGEIVHIMPIELW